MTGQLSLFDHRPEDEKSPIKLEQELGQISINMDMQGARLTDLIPEGATLALTRNYSPRTINISRILSLLEERKFEKIPITRDEIGEQLSMTYAVTQGTINVMRKMDLIYPKNRITPFGSLVFSFSPYLDDSGLLWILHYLIASNASLVLWSNLFNIVLVNREEITIHEASADFQILEGRWSEKSIKVKVPKELGAIFRTYTEDLFSDLRIFYKEDTGVYSINSNTEIIPPEIWLCAILVYRDFYYPRSSALEVPLIVRANYSPGRILRQNEANVRKALDDLHNIGILTVETRSGLDQVRFKRDITWISAISDYLQRRR